jgi:hypothetical protein
MRGNHCRAVRGATPCDAHRDVSLPASSAGGLWGAVCRASSTWVGRGARRAQTWRTQSHAIWICLSRGSTRSLALQQHPAKHVLRQTLRWIRAGWSWLRAYASARSSTQSPPLYRQTHDRLPSRGRRVVHYVAADPMSAHTARARLSCVHARSRLCDIVVFWFGVTLLVIFYSRLIFIDSRPRFHRLPVTG